MLPDFDYASYVDLLARLTDSNACLDFHEAIDSSSRYFIVRHDVDFSPEAALRMAEVEATCGIRATYFVLLSAPDYNVLDPEHCGFPRRLVELGHEVGLHYDMATFAAVPSEARPGLLRLQADVLGTLAATPVRVISMHNPSLSGEDPFRSESGFVNAYDDRFTRNIAYVSDSCGAWRDEAAALFDQDVVPAQLQLLVHPLFWDEARTDRWTVLERFVDERIRQVRARGEYIRACWSAHAGVVEHDRRAVSGTGS